MDLQSCTRLRGVIRSCVRHVSPCKRSPKRPIGLSAPLWPDEFSSKSCKMQVALYVYVATERASIPVHMCRILSTLTATGLQTWGLSKLLCASVVGPSLYLCPTKRACALLLFSLLPWVLLLRTPSASMLALKKKKKIVAPPTRTCLLKYRCLHYEV